MAVGYHSAKSQISEEDEEEGGNGRANSTASGTAPHHGRAGSAPAFAPALQEAATKHSKALPCSGPCARPPQAGAPCTL